MLRGVSIPERRLKNAQGARTQIDGVQAHRYRGLILTKDETQLRLEIVPVSRAEAQSYVRRWHRHHPPALGGVFQIAAADEEGRIRGVAMVGRPVARALQDGFTLEVNRVATDGCPNACSALYAASWRAARALGWRKLITYTLASESGSSLRGAGWRVIGERKGRSWAEASVARPRDDTYTEHGEQKVLWEAA